MAQRLRGGLHDGAGSRKVDDGAGSRKIFDRKFWQPDTVSESLQGLGFERSCNGLFIRNHISNGHW
jgi:hypothetical protein